MASSKKSFSYPPIITLETITPAQAAEWLKGNTVNRRLVLHHVERLASEMLAGEWRITGDCIKLNGDRLLDGQHRLQAIVQSPWSEADKPLKMKRELACGSSNSIGIKMLLAKVSSSMSIAGPSLPKEPIGFRRIALSPRRALRCTRI